MWVIPFAKFVKHFCVIWSYHNKNTWRYQKTMYKFFHRLSDIDISITLSLFPGSRSELTPLWKSMIIQLYIHEGTMTWPLSRYVKLRVVHAPGMPGTFPPTPRVSDPDMHHGTCVTHVPWCMPGPLTSGFLCSRWAGKAFPAFPAHAQPAILRIW